MDVQTTKKSKMEFETESELHEDVMSQIFLHLPAKSLARFKCVSRHYKALISSRRFTKIVLERHPEPDSTLILLKYYKGPIRRHNNDPSFTNGMILPRHNGDIQGTINGFKPQYFPQKLAKSRPVGTCHGLICFSNYGSCTNAHVWNPLTNQFRTFNFQPLYGYLSVVGFGFDTVKDYYKVVRINMHKSRLPNLMIEICELRNTKIRTIELPSAQVPFLLSNATPITVTGSSHWLALHPKNKNLQIVKFDMGSEKFVEIPFSSNMPNIVYDDDNIHQRRVKLALAADRLRINEKVFTLGVLKETLCLFIYTCSSSKVETWLLKYDDSNVVWIKLCDLQLIERENENVVGCTADGEVVVDNRRISFAYDPWRERHRVLNLSHEHLPDDFHRAVNHIYHSNLHQAVAYVESLVNVWPQ